MKDNEISLRGFSTLAFALIPWALSIGAAGWLAFYWGVHDTEGRLAAEKRVAAAVGEESKPTAKYKIILAGGSFFIEKARYDGDQLELYYKNNRHVRLYNYCFFIKQKAADETIIGQDSECFPGDDRALNPGERSELIRKVSVDDRTTEIVVGFDKPLEGD